MGVPGRAKREAHQGLHGIADRVETVKVMNAGLIAALRHATWEDSMATQSLAATLFRAIPELTLMLAGGAASANPVYWTDWTDWTGADTDPGPGFIGHGTITTLTQTVDVTYTNAAGVSFYQTGGGIDYYTPRIPTMNCRTPAPKSTTRRPAPISSPCASPATRR
jgi:hypothetical protein